MCVQTRTGAVNSKYFLTTYCTRDSSFELSLLFIGATCLIAKDPAPIEQSGVQG